MEQGVLVPRVIRSRSTFFFFPNAQLLARFTSAVVAVWLGVLGMGAPMATTATCDAKLFVTD